MNEPALKVASFDIDGVLCNEHPSGWTPYPERTYEYYMAKTINNPAWVTLIKKLLEEGVHVCFVTSRAACSWTLEWLEKQLHLNLPSDQVHVFMGVSTANKGAVLQSALTGFMGGKRSYTHLRIVHFDDKYEPGVITTKNYVASRGSGVISKVGVTVNKAYPEVERWLTLNGYLPKPTKKVAKIESVTNDQGGGTGFCSACEYVLGHEPLNFPTYCPGCRALLIW